LPYGVVTKDRIEGRKLERFSTQFLSRYSIQGCRFVGTAL